MNVISNRPYWWDEFESPKSISFQSLPSEVDVVIVGAGHTGLTAALYLARGGQSVVVLDTLNPGQGASSRNGGMIGGVNRVPIDQLINKYGHTLASRLLSELHIESTQFCKSLMNNSSINCDFDETGRFQAYWSKKEYEHQAKKLDTLMKMIPVEAEIIPKSKVKDEINSEIYAGGNLFYLHGGLNPAKWVAGICDAAISAGAVVQGQTHVSNIEKKSNGFAVSTQRGQINAGQVLLATNGYTTSRIGRICRHVFPIPSFIVVTEKLGVEHIHELIPKARMIVETRARHCYFRPSPDRSRIVFGGRAAMFKPPDWFYESQLRMLLTEIFPSLKNIKIEYRWWGLTGFTFELMPHIGKFDGIWHALGYCGNGNGMAPWLGYKVAMKMQGDPAGETAFSEIQMPVRWYHQGHPWFLPYADIKFRMHDLWANITK